MGSKNMFPLVIDQSIPSAKCTDEGLDLPLPTAPQKSISVMQRTSFTVHQIDMAAYSPSGPALYVNTNSYLLLKTHYFLVPLSK